MTSEVPSSLARRRKRSARDLQKEGTSLEQWFSTPAGVNFPSELLLLNAALHTRGNLRAATPCSYDLTASQLSFAQCMRVVSCLKAVQACSHRLQCSHLLRIDDSSLRLV